MGQPAEDAGRGVDGVRMAILSKRFEAIARRMQNTLFRTGRSGVLNTAHDFSCVIMTRDGRLLAAAEVLSPQQIQAAPDCGLVMMSQPRAVEKLRIMVKGAELAREQAGV